MRAVLLLCILFISSCRADCSSCRGGSSCNCNGLSCPMSVSGGADRCTRQNAAWVTVVPFTCLPLTQVAIRWEAVTASATPTATSLFSALLFESRTALSAYQSCASSPSALPVAKFSNIACSGEQRWVTNINSTFAALVLQCEGPQSCPVRFQLSWDCVLGDGQIASLVMCIVGAILCFIEFAFAAFVVWFRWRKRLHIKPAFMTSVYLAMATGLIGSIAWMLLAWAAAHGTHIQDQVATTTLQILQGCVILIGIILLHSFSTAYYKSRGNTKASTGCQLFFYVLLVFFICYWIAGGVTAYVSLGQGTLIRLVLGPFLIYILFGYLLELGVAIATVVYAALMFAQRNEQKPKKRKSARQLLIVLSTLLVVVVVQMIILAIVATIFQGRSGAWVPGVVFYIPNIFTGIAFLLFFYLLPLLCLVPLVAVIFVNAKDSSKVGVPDSVTQGLLSEQQNDKYDL